MTFFVEKKVKGQILKADTNYLPFYNNRNANMAYITKHPQGIDLRRQGPFEDNSNVFDSRYRFGMRPLGPSYTYNYITLSNVPYNSEPDFENIPEEGTIPERFLFSFDIYDLHDKGTDVKTADYSKRRLFPIEDFAIGSPTSI